MSNMQKFPAEGLVEQFNAEKKDMALPQNCPELQVCVCKVGAHS